MIPFIRKHPILSFFVFTFFINWTGFALMVAGFFPALGEWPLFYEGHEIARFRGRRTLLIWAPNIAALLVLLMSGQRKKAVDLFKKYFFWRLKPRWYGIAIIVPVLLVVLAICSHKILGGSIDLKNISALPAIFLLRNLFAFSTGGIGEEAGWRGFAQDRLQKKWGPLRASITVGFLWGCLHYPMWIIRKWQGEDIVYFMVMVISLSVILAWMYNCTETSLLGVALTHNVFNAAIATASFGFAAPLAYKDFAPVFAAVMIVFSLFLIYTTKGKLGYQWAMAGD